MRIISWTSNSFNNIKCSYKYGSCQYHNTAESMKCYQLKMLNKSKQPNWTTFNGFSLKSRMKNESCVYFQPKKGSTYNTHWVSGVCVHQFSHSYSHTIRISIFCINQHIVLLSILIVTRPLICIHIKMK